MKRQCFLTDTDTEGPALTTSQMREVDRIAMRERGPNLFQMMENAAEVWRRWRWSAWVETGKKRELLC